MAVLCIVPIAMFFMGVFWVIGKYTDNDADYERLVARLSSEQDRAESRKKAEKRRDYYNAVSLSPRIEDASNEYLTWLKTLMKETNLRAKTFTPRDGGDLKEGRKVIGKRKKFTVPATGKLDDLTNFLTRFYSVDALHRINSIKIIPQNESGNNEKKVRSGLLSVSLEIEVISLKTAEENPDFQANVRALARSKEDYKSAILKRNIFGPANNEPTITARVPSTIYTDSKGNISVTAKDADEKDILKIELVESSVEDAELVVRDGSRLGKLVVPGQEVGEYKFKLKVTDNGFPPKSAFKDVSVKFKKREPRVVKKKEEPPKAKPYTHAKQTKITAITRMKTGEWQIWVKVKTTGKKYKLLVGESFKLDDLDWSVKSIKPHEAVLQVDGKLLTYNEGVSFDNPINEVVLESKSSDEKMKSDATKTNLIGPESDAPPSPRIKTNP